jgi:hypothetical protein
VNKEIQRFMKGKLVSLHIAATIIIVRPPMSKATGRRGPSEITIGSLISKSEIASWRPSRLIFTTGGGIKLRSIAIQALDHPKKEEVFAREAKISLINQPE